MRVCLKEVFWSQSTIFLPEMDDVTVAAFAEAIVLAVGQTIDVNCNEQVTKYTNGTKTEK